MQCTSPYNYKQGEYQPHVPPCGKCLSCRINRQREWAARIILERRAHEHAIFYTLTYDEENVPSELSKPHHQQFIKRWRNEYGKQPRYFACGEYGSLHGRPHYHGIFFGEQARLIQTIAKRSRTRQVIVTDPRFEKTWGMGSTYIKACDDSTAGSNIARYVAAYVVKGTLQTSEIENKKEWSLQSRRPYIGKPAVKHLCEALSTRSGAMHCGIIGTVPNLIRSNGKSWLIPKRIREEVAYELGYPFLPVPVYDGVEIDMEGNAIIKEKYIGKKTQSEALAAENAYRARFRAKSARNATPETG